MPREWVKILDKAPAKTGALSHAQGATPLAELHLWPYRSLPRRGFVLFIAATAAALSLPLMAMLGSPVLWGLLPFITLAVAGVWWGISRSYRDGEKLEELRLWPDRIEILRHDARKAARSWEANPYWISLHLKAKDGPVEQYLTIKGAGREVELGAFLTPEERLELHDELQRALDFLRH